MYLKSLTLKGFKSFADRTVMKFEPGVAAIVGPNGSGKSNISDAVLWVLGERNAKNLRGQAMEDVIFAGARNRKPVNVAEVELCLDNSDGTLPVDYSEVSIGRRMYRSGESEYLVNGAVVRRMDVLDILHDSGLGTGTNSIISQGNLDSILSSRPEDRRALIEEAAGILKHKERKRRSLRKLERMDGNLARVKDIAREVERQLKPLERKAKRAKTHAELTGRLSECRLDLAVDDLRGLQRRWDAAQVREAALLQEQDKAKDALDAAQAHVEELQKKLEERDVKVASLGERHARAQRMVERLSSQGMVLKERRNHIVKDLDRVRADLEEGASRVGELEREVDRAKADHASATEKQKRAKEKLSSISKNHDDKRIERNGLRKRVETLTAEQRGIVHRLETAQAAQEALKNELSEAEATASVLAARKKDLELRLEAARSESEEKNRLAESLSADLERKRSEESESRSRMNQALVQRNEARRECDEARNVYTRLSAERSALEEQERASERTNPMLAWLLDESEAAHGLSPIGHGIVVPAYLEVVVETLLGSDVNALPFEGDVLGVVGESIASGQEGEAVFLSQSMAAEGDDCVQPRLIDRLEVSPELDGFVRSLVGDVLLADDYRQAIALSRNQGLRAVSADGCVSWPCGKVVLANGASAKQGGSLARRRRIVELKESESEAKKRYDELVKRSSDLEEVLRSRQAQTLKLSEDLAQMKGKEASASAEASRLVSSLSALEKDMSTLESQIKKNQASLTDAQPKTDGLASQISELSAKLSANKQEVSDLEASLKPLQREVVSLSQQLSDARLDVARLDEREAYAARMLQTRSMELKSHTRKSSEAHERILVYEGLIKRVDPLLSVLAALGDSATVTMLRLEEQNAEERRSSSGLSGQVAQATQDMRKSHEVFDGLSAQIAELRVEKGRLEVQVETVVKSITEEQGVSLETALARDAMEDREQTESEVASLERRIKNLGTINPDAAKEFEEISKRHDFLTGQLADMRQARAALVRITNVIDERMRDDFLATFNRVNDNFASIFSVLFPGGQAHLSLVDPDDLEQTGVDVNAQPAGKRVRKMSLLSGGEKSMTAMALLFAVYGIRRTPFYILDEVEAALDDTNLRRLIAYLQKVRLDTQLIMITHQRRTMESADILYGVSMQADGITKVLSQRLEDAIAVSKEE